ncbi:MAG: amidase family protein, partial [Burkholderiaceae bacterium]
MFTTAGARMLASKRCSLVEVDVAKVWVHNRRACACSARCVASSVASASGRVTEPPQGADIHRPWDCRRQWRLRSNMETLMTALWRRSAQELATLIASKQVTSAEVIEAHLARIDAVNPKLNAIVRVLADEARAAAIEADRQVAVGATLGPLHGVPFTVKENIDMAGLPTTWGVKAFAGAVVPIDAPVVERMRAAGAIAIGRTNLPDMALRVHTDSSLHGLTRNPWNAGRSAGGSSGGEAVALATG